jgi:putative Mg2+ transporter-C (MgtC) family protein
MDNNLELLGRIALGGFLGFLIGWERAVRGQDAGDRTFGLVAGGAAAFTVVGVAVFPATAEKLIAGIVTGVGFIGAGLVLRSEHGSIHGLTTATAIWTASAIGVLAGVGLLFIACAVTAIVIVALELRNIPGLRYLDAHTWAERFTDDDGPG